MLRRGNMPVLLALVFGTAAGSWGQSGNPAQEVQETYDRAMGAYRAGNYAKAIDDFERAQRMGRKTAGIKLGQCYFTLGDYEKAAKYLQTAIQDNPADPDAKRWLGDTYLKLGQTENARRVFQGLVDAAPHDTGGLVGLGRVYLLSNDRAKAIDTFQLALKEYAKDPGALAGLGEAYDIAGDPNRALDAYRQAVELASNDPGVYLGYANALDRAGKSQDAIAQYRLALRSDPNAKPATYRHYGDLLAAAGHCDQALDAWERVVATGAADDAFYNNVFTSCEKQNKPGQQPPGSPAVNAMTLWLRRVVALSPKDALPQEKLGLIELRQQHWDEAQKAFDAALQSRPELPESLNGRGEIYKQAEKWQEAAKDFEKASRIDPKNPAIRRNLALAYFKIGNWPSSIDANQKVLELDAQDAPAKVRLAQSYLKNNQPEQAEPLFAGFVQADSSSVEALKGLGEAQSTQKKWSEAARTYERLREVAPKDPDVLYGLAGAYTGTNDLPKVADTYRELITLQPGEAVYHYNLAECLLNQQQWEEAAKEYEAANKAGNLDQALRFDLSAGLGQAYFKFEKFGESAAAYKQASELKPNDPDVLYNLGLAYSKAGDRQAAQSQYEILKDLDKTKARALLGYINKMP